MSHRLLLPLLGLILTTGCYPDPTPPNGSNGECNDDKVCDPSKESCQSCPGDCSCCHAVVVGFNQGVTDPEATLGRPDGKFAQLAEGSVLGLAMGQGIVNQVNFDFNLVGQVTETSSGSGGVTVLLKDGLPWAEGKWHKIGPWSPGTTAKTGFDVGHVPFSGPSFSEIKLEVTPGTTARLDAIEAINCTNP